MNFVDFLVSICGFALKLMDGDAKRLLVDFFIAKSDSKNVNAIITTYFQRKAIKFAHTTPQQRLWNSAELCSYYTQTHVYKQ